MFKYWKKMDKTVKSNCICLFISLCILGVLLAKHQDRCMGYDAFGAGGKQKPMSAAMRKYYSACVMGPYGEFRPPNEVGVILGNNSVRPRIESPTIVPMVQRQRSTQAANLQRYYRAANSDQ